MRQRFGSAMPEAQAATEIIKNVATIAGQLTVAGLLLWFVVMFLTGRIVRREELEAERERTNTERENGIFWRDRYLGVFGTAQAAITTLQQTTEATRDAMTSLRATVETALQVKKSGR